MAMCTDYTGPAQYNLLSFLWIICDLQERIEVFGLPEFGKKPSPRAERILPGSGLVGLRKNINSTLLTMGATRSEKKFVSTKFKLYKESGGKTRIGNIVVITKYNYAKVWVAQTFN